MINRLPKIFLLITFLLSSTSSYACQKETKECIASLLVATAVGTLLTVNEMCRSCPTQQTLLAQCNINPLEFANKTNFEQHQYLYDKCNISDECADFDLIVKDSFCGDRLIEHATICPIQGINPYEVVQILENGFEIRGKNFHYKYLAKKNPKSQKYNRIELIPSELALAASQLHARKGFSYQQRVTYSNSTNTCPKRQRIQQPKKGNRARHRN